METCIFLELKIEEKENLEVNGYTRDKIIISNQKNKLSFYDNIRTPRIIRNPEGLDLTPNIEEMISETLTCPICTNIYIEPHLTLACMHLLCKKCIENSIKTKKECPICRAKIESKRHTRKDTELANLINILIPDIDRYNKYIDSKLDIHTFKENHAARSEMLKINASSSINPVLKNQNIVNNETKAKVKEAISTEIVNIQGQSFDFLKKKLIRKDDDLEEFFEKTKSNIPKEIELNVLKKEIEEEDKKLYFLKLSLENSSFDQKLILESTKVRIYSLVRVLKSNEVLKNRDFEKIEFFAKNEKLNEDCTFQSLIRKYNLDEESEITVHFNFNEKKFC